MGVPETPKPQGNARLLTVPEITERHGISRQAIHAYRTAGVFPQPAQGQGSTRLRFREDEVDAFFAANPKRPGRRTDRQPVTRGGPMPARDKIVRFVTENLSALDGAPVDPETGHAVDDVGEFLDELLDAYSRQVASDYDPDA